MFGGLVFFLNPEDGELDAHVRAVLEDKITTFGGAVAEVPGIRVTHVVDVSSKGKGAHIAKTWELENVVTPEFVDASIQAGEPLEAAKFKPPAKKVASAAGAKKKRSLDNGDGDDKDDEKKASDDAKKGAPAVKKQQITVKGRAAVDTFAGDLAKTCHVLDDGTVWDCLLNQTNIGVNSNKFFVSQLLERDGGVNEWHFFTRWGRVGQSGQKKIQKVSSVAEGQALFAKKFKEKTGNDWNDLSNFVAKTGKYVLLERDYGADDEVIDDDGDENDKGKEEAVECQLTEEVKSFVDMIFDPTQMASVLKEMNFDVKKAPLGKLKSATLKLGLEKLHEIESAIDKQASKSQLAQLSSEYYTLVPHAFGMKPPTVISDLKLLRKELELVEALGDIEIATKIDKAPQGGMHPSDWRYSKLNAHIRVELDPDVLSSISKSIQSTHALTWPHNQYKINIERVFAIERQGEKERFAPHLDDSNRVLLWHGSRITNWVGILSQGLRIAPPEAPVTGYMFGKGIYFANVASKSANYCHFTKDSPDGVIILCEVALGTSHRWTKANNNLTKAQVKGDTVHGVGKWTPSSMEQVKGFEGAQIPMGPLKDSGIGDSALLYDEFITYELERSRMRYIVHFKAQFK